MKHCTFTILALLYIFTCYAQNDSEVEFTVRQKQVPTYYYKQLQDVNGYGALSVKSPIVCAQKACDTIHYYAFKDESDTVGLMRSGYVSRIGDGNQYFLYSNSAIYINVKDTVWCRHTTRKDGGYNEQLFTNGIIKGLSTAYDGARYYVSDSITRQNNLFTQVTLQAIRSSYMLDTNATVRVSDTSYKCLKVLIVTCGIRPNYYGRGKGWRMQQEEYFQRSIYYLRKSDYLPIKIENAPTVTKLEPYAAYKLESYPLTLVKAVE